MKENKPQTNNKWLPMFKYELDALGVDMLDFVLIGFAVFNVADSAVCVGAALLVVAGVFTKGGKSYIASLEEAEKESAKRKKKAKQGECACGRCARHDEETRDDCEED